MNTKIRILALCSMLTLLYPAVAQASDYSGLMPLLIAFVALVGGVAAGFEWMLLNGIADSFAKDGKSDPERENKSRFGCGPAIALWVVNSIIVWVVLKYYNW